MTPLRNMYTSLLRIFLVFIVLQLSRAYPEDNSRIFAHERDEPLPLHRYSRSETGGIKKYPVLPCGATARLNVNESVFIEGPGHQLQNRVSSEAVCKWRFLFSTCRLAISCPSTNSRSAKSSCEEYLDVRQANGKTRRVCVGRKAKVLDSSGETELTYRTTSSILSGLGFRCRLTCAGTEDAQNSGSKPTEELPLTVAEPTNCTCGLRNDNVIKIVNGIETKVNEFPWMVGLVRVGGSIPFCGAALINSKYVLTAAHCVSGRTPKNLEVVLNDHNTHTGSETKIIRKKVESIISHGSYTNRLDYDAALIKIRDGLEKEMEEGITVPVCLPRLDGLRNTYEGQSVTVSGWGVTGETSPQSPVLKKTEVTVVTDKTCHLSYPGSITSRMMCAAAPMKDACQGDSGGPLIHLKEEQYTQIGIVSWGHGCARPNKPGVYSRVTEFMPWIMRLTADGSSCLTKEERIKLLGLKQKPQSSLDSIEVSSQELLSSNENRASQEQVSSAEQVDQLEDQGQQEEQNDEEYQFESQERPVLLQEEQPVLQDALSEEEEVEFYD